MADELVVCEGKHPTVSGGDCRLEPHPKSDHCWHAKPLPPTRIEPQLGTCDTTDWPHLRSDGTGKKRPHEKRESCTDWKPVIDKADQGDERPKDTVDGLAQTIIADCLSGKDAKFLINRVRARIHIVISFYRQKWSEAGTSASVAPTPDNVNDPLTNKLPLQDDIERVLLRRLFEKRLDGYTLESANEIARLVGGSPASEQGKDATMGYVELKNQLEREHKWLNDAAMQANCDLDSVARSVRELQAWKESAMKQLGKGDALRNLLPAAYLGWDINEAAADYIGKRAAAPSPRSDSATKVAGIRLTRDEARGLAEGLQEFAEGKVRSLEDIRRDLKNSGTVQPVSGTTNGNIPPSTTADKSVEYSPNAPEVGRSDTKAKDDGAIQSIVRKHCVHMKIGEVRPVCFQCNDLAWEIAHELQRRVTELQAEVAKWKALGVETPNALETVIRCAAEMAKSREDKLRKVEAEVAELEEKCAAQHKVIVADEKAAEELRKRAE